jgi:hypothetical protein
VARAALGAGVAVTLTRSEIEESARTIFGEQGTSASGPHVDRVAEAGHAVSARASEDDPALLRFGRELARDPAVQRAVLAHSAAYGLTDQEQRYARSDDIAELKRSIAELKSDLEDQQDLNRDLVLFQDRLMTKNDALASEVRDLHAALPSPQRDDGGAAAAAQGAAEIDAAAMLLAEASAEATDDEVEDEFEGGGALGWVRPSLERVRRKRAAAESRGEWLVAAGVGVAAAIVLFAIFRRRIEGAASTRAAAQLVARATAAMWRFVGR